MNRLIVGGLGMLLGCVGCRGVERLTGQEPIVDMRGVNVAQFEQDLTECRLYADQVPVGRQAATGAVAGAATGAVVGAVIGDSRTASRGAGVGAATGTLRGTAGGLQDRQRVLRNCLRNRGYAVLN